MKAAWAAGALVLILAGCGRGETDRIVFEDEVFYGNLKADRNDRTSFVARGGPASGSLEGARQAASYQAVQHCIGFLGTSDIEWINGPDVEDTALMIEDDEVVLSGRCVEP